MNVDGISKYSQVSVEILDERFNVLTGYSKDDCTAPEESGLRQLVTWQGREAVEKVKNPIRIRVNFAGVRAEDLKTYAIYVEHLNI